MEKLRITDYKIKNADILIADATIKYEKALSEFNAFLTSDDRPDKIMIDKLTAIKKWSLKEERVICYQSRSA